jgi:hypothetical protein
VEYLKLIYKEFLQKQKPLRVFSDIGELINLLRSKESGDGILETHYIVCLDAISKELMLSKTKPSSVPVYIVEFYREYLYIKIPSKESIHIKYQDPIFQYGYILPF